MKYESDILKRLINTYGVVGNPRYISEIIKEFIVRGKECYPELFTYQSDWLAHIDEFGLNPTYTVSYTGQSIYAPNTLERPVKSAILKGCTKYRDIDTGEILETFEEGRNLELISVKMPVLTTIGKNLLNKENIVSGVFNSGTLAVLQSNNRLTIDKNNAIKVKPNTTYTLSYTTGYKVGVMELNATKTAITVDGKWQVKPTGHTFTTNANTYYVTFNISKTDDSVIALSDKDTLNLMFEQGSITTTYEPYKTNILTVNGDVTLRGIDDVEDTLDCLTGEVTQRIGEVVLDGSESWETLTRGRYCLKDILNNVNRPNLDNINFKCDKLKPISYSEEYSGTLGISLYVGTNYDFIVRTDIQAIEEFKQWLSNNPTTVQYLLATESVKTVDLSVKDQDNQVINQLSTFEGGTHFTTSSQEGSLLPSVSVSVETDLEETLRVCSLEGNTM